MPSKVKQESDNPKRHQPVVRDSGISKDSFTTSIVKASLRISEQIAEVEAFRKADSFSLTIRRNESEKQFLARAKKHYREMSKTTVRKGRQSVEDLALSEISTLAYELGREPQFSEATLRLQKIGLAKKTAEKYERLYRLYRSDPGKLQNNDQKWLVKNFGIQSLTLDWRRDKVWQAWEAKARAAGIFAKIAAIFDGTMSPEEISRQRSELEVSRLKILTRLRQQRPIQ